MELPHFDLGNAQPSCTVAELAEACQGRAQDWIVEIRVVGDRIVSLGLEIEDIHFEHGKMMLVTGSSQTIHVEPLELDNLPPPPDMGDDG